MTDAYSGFSIDFSRMNFDWAELDTLQEKFARAAREMIALENGAIKNPDENRKVTHFTDRAVYRTSELFNQVEEFASAVRNGSITGGTGKRFEAVVVNGIGGSALGPQLLQFAINGPYWNEKRRKQRNNGLKIYFLDNTDPAGLKDLLEVIDLETTLHLCVSKVCEQGLQGYQGSRRARNARYSRRFGQCIPCPFLAQKPHFSIQPLDSL